MVTQLDDNITLSREELVAKATELGKIFKETPFAAEEAGHVPARNVELMRQSGLLRIGAPVRFGGLDVDLETAFDCTVEIAKGCGASAWVFSLYNSHLWWVGYHSLQVAEEIFADGPDVIIASASAKRWNKLEEVEGGYRLSGNWMMSSGIDHAAWVFTLTSNDAGELFLMIIPTSDIAIDHSSWNVSGLQGTGSKDFDITDAFVPTHRVLPFAAQLKGELGLPTDLYPQRRYQVPQTALQLWDLASPAVGLAYAAVEEMTARLTGTSGSVKSADSTLVQARIAESATEADTARMLMRYDTKEAQDLAQAGKLTQLDLARYNRDKAYAVKLAVSAVNRMFDMAGGRSLFKSDRLQLIHRDAQACMHRDKLLFELASTNYGRALLGLSFETVG